MLDMNLNMFRFMQDSKNLVWFYSILFEMKAKIHGQLFS